MDLWKIFIRFKQEQLDEAEEPVTQKVRLEQKQKGLNGPISYVPSQKWERSKALASSSESSAQDGLAVFLPVGRLGPTPPRTTSSPNTGRYTSSRVPVRELLLTKTEVKSTFWQCLPNRK